MSATRKPEMSRAQKAIERVHHKIMDMRDSTPMRDGSIEAEEKYLEVYKKAYRESQSSTYFAAAERYRLFLQGKPVPGAPRQPGATQPEYEGVSHEPAPMTAAHIPLGGIVEHRLYSKAELTTLLERMARLVVQEAVSAFERGAKLPFGCANDNVKAAIRAIADDTKLLQQLREATERT